MNRNKTAKRGRKRRVVFDLTFVFVVFVSLRLFYRIGTPVQYRARKQAVVSVGSSLCGCFTALE
ncbi:MAG: hypothetical protein ACREAB_09165, partial [Blastocatellia bacterium]